MFKTLDTVKWETLETQFGYASEIPKLIRLIATTSGEEQDQAERSLSRQMLAISRLYPCAPHVMPYLLEMIESLEVSNRHWLIDLHHACTVTSDSDYLPYSFTSKAYEYDIDKSLNEQIQKGHPTTAHDAIVSKECWEQGKLAVPVLVRCLEDNDRNVRIWAAYAIAWLADDKGIVSDALKNQLNAARTLDEYELANLLMSTGLSYYVSGGQPSSNLFLTRLHHSSVVVRASAAISCAWWTRSSDVLNTLEVSATNTDVLDGLNDMPFMRGCIATYAARVLEDIRTAHWRISHPYFTANPDFEANKPEE